jgi:hypothetical protein
MSDNQHDKSVKFGVRGAQYVRPERDAEPLGTRKP